jgi:site-specific DNA-methyltransferase (adenine-specific)
MRTQRDNKTHDSSFHGYLKSNIVAGETREGYNDSGGASRFFYVPKAGKRERPNVEGVAHPTVKPIALMRYLVRLVTPLGGTVLEPFAGSGTTVEACILEGFDCIAIEMTDDYLPLIAERVRRSTEDKEGRLL